MVGLVYVELKFMRPTWRNNRSDPDEVEKILY
jgi:hypothetical protein